MATVDTRPSRLNLVLPASGPMTVVFTGKNTDDLSSLLGMKMWIQPRKIREADITEALVEFDIDAVNIATGTIVASLDECSGLDLPATLIVANGNFLYATGEVTKLLYGTCQRSNVGIRIGDSNVNLTVIGSSSGGGGGNSGVHIGPTPPENTGILWLDTSGDTPTPPGIIDGGTSSTTTFDNIIDGGDSSTTVFDNIIDGGTSNG